MTAHDFCAAEDCDRRRRSKGLCEMHYRRLWRHGTTHKPTRSERFWAQVDKRGDCWLWIGQRDAKGYGRFSTGQFTFTFAHRFAYAELIGPLGDKQPLDHLCRVPACVNPAHLEPVTTRENTLRGIGPTAQNARKTHCIRGHEFTDENTCRRSDGRRVCITCRRARDKRRYTRDAA